MANAAERRDERLLPFERSSSYRKKRMMTKKELAEYEEKEKDRDKKRKKKKKSTRKRNRKPVADIDA